MIFLATASRWFMGGGWKVVAVVGGVVAIFGAGWITRGNYEDSRRLAEITRGMGKANKASSNLEKDNERTRVVFRTITKAVDKALADPRYSDTCFDAIGVQLSNAALTASEPAQRVSDAPNP